MRPMAGVGIGLPSENGPGQALGVERIPPTWPASDPPGDQCQRVAVRRTRRAVQQRARGSQGGGIHELLSRQPLAAPNLERPGEHTRQRPHALAVQAFVDRASEVDVVDTRDDEQGQQRQAHREPQIEPQAFPGSSSRDERARRLVGRRHLVSLYTVMIKCDPGSSGKSTISRSTRPGP